jgi:hypothetical protein
MSNIIPQITVDEFLMFKSQNIEILLDAQEYIKKVGNTNKINKTNKQSNGGGSGGGSGSGSGGDRGGGDRGGDRNKKSYQKYPNNKSSNWRQSKYGQYNNKDSNISRSKPTSYDSEDDILYTKFRSCLNKLSANNIGTISGEIKVLQITKKEHVEKLIDFIFSKAVKETKFTTIYAAFVSHMMSYKINLGGTDVVFAALFFKKCKAMFDECLSFDVELEAQYLNSVSTKISKTFNFKDEVIGCINFVGELYNYKILNDNVVNICLNSIIKALNSNKVYCIDIICNFIRTISKRFSVDNNANLNTHIKTLIKLKDSSSIKEKFIIMDLIDYLNDNNISSVKY